MRRGTAPAIPLAQDRRTRYLMAQEEREKPNYMRPIRNRTPEARKPPPANRTPEFRKNSAQRLEESKQRRSSLIAAGVR